MNNSTDAVGKLILRLTIGILVLFHGVIKIINPGIVEGFEGPLTNFGLPPNVASVVAYGVYIGEVVAPLMMILGLFARVGGALLVINMIFALVLVHQGQFLSLTDRGGYALELQACYLFGALAVAFLGSGRIAIKPD